MAALEALLRLRPRLTLVARAGQVSGEGEPIPSSKLTVLLESLNAPRRRHKELVYRGSRCRSDRPHLKGRMGYRLDGSTEIARARFATSRIRGGRR